MRSHVSTSRARRISLSFALVVNVTDQASAAAVRASGATPRLVAHSAAQLAGVLSIVGRQSAESRGLPYDEEQDAAMRQLVEAQIEAESLALANSGRVYDDGIIDPRDTRTVLGYCLSVINRLPISGVRGGFGVFRM